MVHPHQRTIRIDLLLSGVVLLAACLDPPFLTPIAHAQSPGALVGARMLDVGVAAPSDLTAGTRNPAGLAHVREERIAVFAIHAGTARQSWDALRLHREQRGEEDGGVLPDELSLYDGLVLDAHAQASLLEITQREWAVRLTIETTRRVLQIQAESFEYRVANTTTARLGFARGREVLRVAGGALSVGLGMDVGARQDVVMDLSASAQPDSSVRRAHYYGLVTGSWADPWFEGFDPQLELGTVLGLQWRSAPVFRGRAHLVLGAVVENLAGVGDEFAQGERGRVGVAFVPTGSGLPTLSLDSGQYRSSYQDHCVGVGASLQWKLGPLVLVAASRPDVESAGVSLDMLGLEFSGGVQRLRADVAPDRREDRTQWFLGLALVPAFQEEPR